LSPNGKYILVLGTGEYNSGHPYYLKVMEVDNNQTDEILNLNEVGDPIVSMAGDGRFQFQFKSKKIILPENGPGNSTRSP
jgi:hypothetical protein